MSKWILFHWFLYTIFCIYHTRKNNVVIHECKVFMVSLDGWTRQGIWFFFINYKAVTGSFSSCTCNDMQLWTSISHIYFFLKLFGVIMFIYLLSVMGFCYFSSLLLWQYTEELGWLMIPILNAKLHIRQEMFVVCILYCVWSETWNGMSFHFCLWFSN